MRKRMDPAGYPVVLFPLYRRTPLVNPAGWPYHRP